MRLAVSVPKTIDRRLNNDIGNTVHKCLQCTWNTDAEFQTQLKKVYVQFAQIKLAVIIFFFISIGNKDCTYCL